MMSQQAINNEILVRANGEKKPVMFRVQRIFTIGHEWYFNTREGVDQGPFLSRDITEMAIESYIKNISN